MKITETTERECCDPKQDFKEYDGARQRTRSDDDLYFCIHCGQLWEKNKSVYPLTRAWYKIEPGALL